MNEGSLFVERTHIVPFFAPIDINGAVFAGCWVNMSEYGRCAILMAHGAGTSAPAVTMLQASDNAGTGSKGLTVLSHPYCYQGVSAVGSTSPLLSMPAVTSPLADILGKFSVTSNSHTFSAVGGSGGTGVASVFEIMEVAAGDLDLANGFNHFAVSIANVGTACVMFGCYILYETVHPQGWVSAAAAGSAGTAGGPVSALD